MPLPLAGIVIVIALLLVIWLLFLPPFSLLRGSPARQAAGDGYSGRVVSKVPPPPPGLAPASRYYMISTGNHPNAAGSISVPLLDPKAANRGLAFYTYRGRAWQRLATGSISPDGASVEGGITTVPTNLIVFQRAAGALQVFGGVPAGRTLGQAATAAISTLNPSGYLPKSNGSVAGPPVVSAPAASYDTVPAVQGQDGADAAAVTQILSSPTAQASHINALVTLASSNGATGVELDYTSVNAQQRQAFTDFIGSLAQKLHAAHRTLGLELPIPTQSGNGWNTGAYDWTALSKSADYLKLLPNTDLSLYRRQVPEALSYLTGQAGVDPRRLILVTSAYSVEKTSQSVQLLTRLQALSIASQIQATTGQGVAGGAVTLVAENLDHGAGGFGMIWDSTTACVQFNYQVGNSTDVVWIQNEFSEGFDLQYVKQFHLGGVAVDNASNDASLGDPWPAIAQMLSTGSPPLLQPNPQLLAPTWLVDGKPLDTSGKTVAEWQTTPADAGSHTVSLIVSDGVVRVLSSARLTLQAGPPPGSTAAPGNIGAGTATPLPSFPTVSPAPSTTPASGG